MGAPEILLEHRDGEKIKKVMRVRKRGAFFLIGSSRAANLRLGGESVKGCHAVLKYRAPHWYICDISGSSDTLVDNESFVEKQIEDKHILKIGKHQIRLVTKRNDKVLFTQEPTTGTFAKQQVVIRRGWTVIETMYLDKGAPLILKDGATDVHLQAPTNGEWIVTEIGKRVVQQRLVAGQEVMREAPFEWDRDILKPFGIISAIFLMLYIGFKLMPAEVKSEAVIDNKSMEMIFSAKTIQKKRMESKTIVTQAKAKKGGNEAASSTQAVKTNPDEAQAPKVTNKTNVALTSLRQSGLNSLIGKIAKRASKSGVMIAATGVTPEQLSGRAFYSNGKATVGGGGSATKTGPSFKLGGVGTKGVGGGASNVGEGTALVGGKVGQGDVAMIDDETVIDGGLDKDVIADVIKRNIGQIRYCYERQLSADRNLYGKVMVKFNIQADGTVAEPLIGNSTLKSAMVEGCILRRLSGWKFPLPKGGTIVRVSYPFLFKALD